MGLWNPPDDIGSNEHIGRRLFNRPSLRGAKDQPIPEGTFEIYHFEEIRDAGDVSVDRLGQSSVDRKVLRYVEPRAETGAATFNPSKEFVGWAVVRAKELLKPAKGPALKVKCSRVPITEEIELSDNNYHAHIERPSEFEGTHGAFMMALYLKSVFERDYRKIDSGSKKHAKRWVWWSSFAAYCSNLYRPSKQK